jgi:predicted transcriptional regulator
MCDMNAQPSPIEDWQLPHEVQSLRPRMRQVASIVYLRGGATVNTIKDDLGGDYNAGGIRTMLGRLEAKGILRCRPAGRLRELYYLPAIVTASVQTIALKRLVDEQFGGAVDAALQHALRLIHSREPTT